MSQSQYEYHVEVDAGEFAGGGGVCAAGPMMCLMPGRLWIVVGRSTGMYGFSVLLGMETRRKVVETRKRRMRVRKSVRRLKAREAMWMRARRGKSIVRADGGNVVLLELQICGCTWPWRRRGRSELN